MDCESCGRHRPSEQVVPARSINGTVLMACGRCRRHFIGRAEATIDLRPGSGSQRQAAAGV
jgi:ribosome-binding protein aMBF1 (putative translation factor)